ncbi:hypothetical protein [Pseudoxanthomonas winnipegensis]|uniref:hypothetical protein n=1 Tax=Pseudoxanthomonas winnipegensis TaxID=2480810 RepID=UPI0013EE85C0|nr:hypothetical protein [Pseudoxanthomonas winnipegensis]
MTGQLFPKPPRRLKQPTKAVLRQQLATITEEVIQLRAEVEHLRAPWWRRLIRRKAA